MIAGFVTFGIFILLLSALLCLFRIAKGPTPPDRTISMDILGTLVVGFCCMVCIATGADFLMNIAIAWALTSFIGTIALAKHLEGKHFDD